MCICEYIHIVTSTHPTRTMNLSIDDENDCSHRQIVSADEERMWLNVCGRRVGRKIWCKNIYYGQSFSSLWNVYGIWFLCDVVAIFSFITFHARSRHTKSSIIFEDKSLWYSQKQDVSDVDEQT